MSGGYFDFNQFRIESTIESIESLILANEDSTTNEYGDVKGTFYADETINEFKKALFYLERAMIYTNRIDYLASGDDSEQSFHSRLIHDLTNCVHKNQGSL